MKAHITAFFAGALFAAGLTVAGMTQPSKVIGFLDFAGKWDPSLAFVMGGAILVNAVLFRVFTKREKPLFDNAFHVPQRKDITPQLVLGSAIFGAGWGLGGYCPGPGLASMAGGSSAIVFVASMAAGMVGYSVWERSSAKSTSSSASTKSAPSTSSPRPA